MDQRSQVYLEFYELHRDSYDSIVFFYEHNQGVIKQLPFEEQLELLAEYLNACFETAQYRKYLAHVDDLIENLIIYNVGTIHGRDEYTVSLFKKAASLFNLERYEESTHVVKELCRIEPHNQNARILYRRNLYQNMTAGYQRVRNFAAMGLLLSAMLTGVDLFASQYLTSGMIDMNTFIRNIIFTTSMLSLFFIEIKIRWMVELVGRAKKRIN